MGMTGRFARNKIKRYKRNFWRKHWWRVGVMAGIALSVAAALGVLWPQQEVPLWATVLAVVVASAGVASDSFYGTSQLAMGRDAEKWTSSALRKRGPRGSVVIDWIPFGERDVDHVLVGRAGVWAVETKYTDFDINLAGPGERYAMQWSAQAERNARTLRLLLRSSGIDVAVAPLVVAWGPEISGTPASIGSVPILRGPDLRVVTPWANGEHALSQAQVDCVRRVLTAHRKRRLKHDRAERRGTSKRYRMLARLSRGWGVPFSS